MYQRVVSIPDGDLGTLWSTKANKIREKWDKQGSDNGRRKWKKRTRKRCRRGRGKWKKRKGRREREDQV